MEQRYVFSGIQAGVGGEQLGTGKRWQFSLPVHTSDHVVQFSRLGGSLGFTLSETRLGDL